MQRGRLRRRIAEALSIVSRERTKPTLDLRHYRECRNEFTQVRTENHRKRIQKLH